VTALLKRLVRRGLLSRNPDARDARRVVLTLTAKGKALDAPRAGTVESKIQKVLRTLDDRDVATAETVLRALARALAGE
jgi:DNA-binding MarR family transcriptional regulator